MKDDTNVSWETQRPKLPKIRNKAVRFLFVWPFVGTLAEVTGLTRGFYWMFGDNPFQSSFTVLVGIVTLTILLIVSCFRFPRMQRFVRAYCITTLVLAVPTAFVLVLRALNGGGVLALDAKNQWIGNLTGNLYLDAVRAGYFGPAAVRFLFPWLFYDHSMLSLLLGLPIMMETQILGFPFMALILCLPPWLAFILIILITLAIACSSFLPRSMHLRLRERCAAARRHIGHRTATGESGNDKNVK